MKPANLPRRLDIPLALQILGLLLLGLVAAQLATLFLTLLLPPAPAPEYRLEDIARSLKGGKVDVRNHRPLMRSVHEQPPSAQSAGWVVSLRSQGQLAELLRVNPADVRLLFYSPPPFAGAGAPPHRPPLASLSMLGVGQSGGRDEHLRLVMVSVLPLEAPLFQLAQGGIGGAGGGFAGGGGFPRGGFPGAPFPGGSQPGSIPTALPPAQSSAPPQNFEPANPPADIPTTAPATSSGQNPGSASPATSAVAPPPAPPGPFSSGPGTPAASPAPPGVAGPQVGPGTTGFPYPGGAYAPSQTSPETAPDRAPNAIAGRLTAAIFRNPRQSPSNTRSVTPSAAAESADVALQTAAPMRPAAIRSVPPRTEWVVPAPVTRGLFGVEPAAFVEGDFVAALRTAPDRWVTVQPLPEPFPNSWQRRVFLWFAISFALVAPLGYLFARRLVAPLAAFSVAAERLGRDPSGAVLALDGPAEIGRAALAFNLMQQRLKRYIDDRTAMVGAISHDLRTPLARIRFRLERAPPDVKAGVLGDVSQMEDMISSVLVFIRDATEPAVRERVDLRSILECVVDDAALVGGDAVLDPGAPASVEVDPLSVQRVVTNLVENALKYGKSAHVRMFTERGDAVTEVLDAGPGLPEEELERVFLPFYRAAPARTLHKGGIGLGLAVSRSIARAHGGDVRLYKEGNGLVAQFRLPLALVA